MYFASNMYFASPKRDRNLLLPWFRYLWASLSVAQITLTCRKHNSSVGYIVSLSTRTIRDKLNGNCLSVVPKGVLPVPWSTLWDVTATLKPEQPFDRDLLSQVYVVHSDDPGQRVGCHPTGWGEPESTDRLSDSSDLHGRLLAALRRSP